MTLESNQEDAILARLKVPDLECGPHTMQCMEGTRLDILGKINAWTTDFDAPNILWLKGHPGVGKSAIATSKRDSPDALQYTDFLVRVGCQRPPMPDAV